MILNWLKRLFRNVKDAWRDIKELSRPHSYSDVNWNPLPWRAENVAIAREESLGPYDYARFGRCDRCEREVWYKIVYASAGVPVCTLLCLTCSTDMVQSSPHILVCHITAQRDKWRREQWDRETKGR